jgi:hypothetical protein
MSTNNALSILFPPGRFVQGSMYKANDKDFEGRPKTYAPGHPKAGQPKITYFFAVAYPKAATDNGHWGNTEWGKQIWAFGFKAWPNGQAQAPTFAWKIEDGDSVVPNKNGKVNATREGFPGHWIVNFSSSFPPRIYTRDASGRAQELLQPDAVKPGYYVQVQGTIDSNETAGNPGIYVNHNMVMLIGYGAEIRQGADPNTVAWHAGGLPAGASSAPVSTAPMPAAGAPAAAPAPGSPPPPPSAAPAPAASPTAVAPAPAFMGNAPPSAPAAPAAPPAPAAPAAGPQMTAKAAGSTYAQFIAQGWTDATLRQHGYMS